MRIGLVVEKFDPLRGGLEQWSVQFASQLLDRGHEVHVVAAGFGEEAPAMPIIPHRLEGVHSRIGFAEAAEQKLRSLCLDVVHDTGVGWYCDVFQPHGGSRRVVLEQSILLVPPWLRPLKRAFRYATPRHGRFAALMERQYVNDGRIMLALSRKMADDFHRLHDVPPERIRLIYNGVDTVRFSPENRERYRESVRRYLGVDDRTTLLLIVAHNFRLKGVPTLLRAMGRLAARRAPVHLAVVGGRRLRKYVRMAGRLGAGSMVTFVGSVHDTVPFYAAADAYVHPTYYDSCSLVVLEALASGLPAITSRFNGVGELMTEGAEGFVLGDPSSVDELLGRIERLFDPDTRLRMGQAARRMARKHTIQRNADAVLAVYEEVIQMHDARHQALMSMQTTPFVVRKIGVPPGSDRRGQTRSKSPAALSSK